MYVYICVYIYVHIYMCGYICLKHSFFPYLFCPHSESHIAKLLRHEFSPILFCPQASMPCLRSLIQPSPQMTHAHSHQVHSQQGTQGVTPKRPSASLVGPHRQQNNSH